MIKYDAAENLRLFIKSGGMGFVLGLIHAVLGILFGGKNKNAALKTAEDIVFAVFACSLTFMFLLDANNGLFRAFILLGEGAGFLIFLLIPEKVIVDIDEAIRSKAVRRAETTLLKVRKCMNEHRERIVKRKEKRLERKKTKMKRKKSIKTLAYDIKDDI